MILVEVVVVSGSLNVLKIDNVVLGKEEENRHIPEVFESFVVYDVFLVQHVLLTFDNLLDNWKVLKVMMMMKLAATMKLMVLLRSLLLVLERRVPSERTCLV